MFRISEMVSEGVTSGLRCHVPSMGVVGDTRPFHRRVTVTSRFRIVGSVDCWTFLQRVGGFMCIPGT